VVVPPRVRRLRARGARGDRPRARGGGRGARARGRARPEPRAGPRRGRARRRHRLFRLFKRTLQKGFVFPTRHASAVDPRGESAGRTRRGGRGFGSEARRPRRTSDAGDVRGASAGAECLGPSRRVDFKHGGDDWKSRFARTRKRCGAKTRLVESHFREPRRNRESQTLKNAERAANENISRGGSEGKTFTTVITGGRARSPGDPHGHPLAYGSTISSSLSEVPVFAAEEQVRGTQPRVEVRRGG
jgi:hypothetical protein